MNNLFNLENKVVIVTGGYGYLGVGIVKSLLSFGAIVYVAGRTKDKFINKFKNENNNKLFFIEIDIMKLESIENCFEKVYKKHERIDVLINNAHSAKGNSQENMPDEDFLYTLDGVLGSVHKAIKSIIPYMKKQQFGKIINIASMYGLVSPDFRIYKGKDCEKYTNPPHYGAAKAGVKQLTKYYAVLLGSSNIQVNAIAPGPFPSLIVQQENPNFVNRLKEKNPLNRIGVPEDLSGSIILLSTNASDFITGQTLQIDGGWTIW
ncbi:SDR family oxidoreductase [Polaribacter haliotis]|uniref:SDR family oxidoreductase n=1 Tax=Polaribacter haliotis TaxID=1888915 RepID=A0A7L8AJB0_9FLAO|nr:SDR family oxidoreductase [Polaribacter haliotis]QOD62085.1 SDR family oxidoreductase [Polaribacter haliotis]